MTTFTKPTRQESLLKIRQAAIDGKLGAADNKGFCVYEHQNRFCGVGCLFSPEQIKDIRKRDTNALSITLLSNEIGRRNIEFVTGLTMSELRFIQNQHDINSDSLKSPSLAIRQGSYFIEAIDKMLKMEPPQDSSKIV